MIGTEHGDPVHGRFWLAMDLASGSLRLESGKRGPVEFIFNANQALKPQNDTSDVDGTLALPTAKIVVRQVPSRELIDGVLGVPLSTAEMLWVLWGEAMNGGGTLIGRRFGTDWIKVWVTSETLTPELVFYRANATSKWRLFSMTREIAGRHVRWEAGYQPREGGLYRTIQLRSVEWTGAAGKLFDVRVALDHIQIAPVISADVFRPNVSRDFESVSLDVFHRRQPLPTPLVNAQTRLH